MFNVHRSVGKIGDYIKG